MMMMMMMMMMLLCREDGVEDIGDVKDVEMSVVYVR